MFSTAVTDAQNRSTPPTGGQPGTNPVQGQDFVAVLNRLAYSSLAASTAAAAAGTPLPDTTRPEPPESVPQTDSGRRADTPRDPADIEGTEPQTTEAERPVRPAEERPDDAYDVSSRSDDTPPAPAQPSETPDTGRRDVAQQAVPTQRTAPAAAHAQAPNGPAATAQAQTAAPATNDAAPPQSGRESAGRSAANGAPQIAAQVTDGASDGQLPQLGHTLSSRAAVAIQSDSGKGAQQAHASRTAPGDPAAAAAIPGAAQANGQASKGKGQAKTGNAAAKNATANGGQNAGQTAGQASPDAAQSAAIVPGIQQRPAAPLPGAGTLAANAGQQTSGARAEPFTLTGSGGSGAAEFGPRSTAPTHAAKPPPPPVPPRIVINQVAVQIQKAFGEGGDRISIQLKPAELGRVDVRLDVGRDGRVAAVITADRPDTLDLLQRDARILQNALQDAGLQADSNSLSFELKGQDHAFDGSPKGGAASGAGDEVDDAGGIVPAASGGPASRGIIADDRVDIQV